MIALRRALLVHMNHCVETKPTHPPNIGPVNIVFTGLYVWVVPVTSGNLYCTNYLSTGNRYRLYISLKTISYFPGFARSMYIVYYETENHSNSKVHAIVRMANFKVYVIWYQRASMRKLASIAFWVLGF